MFSTVFAGYFVTFNATEYEFDVNVYSPIETVTFQAILITERLDPNNDQVNRYEFQLTYFVATNSTQMTGEINVILHEIGKLMLLSIISK